MTNTSRNNSTRITSKILKRKRYLRRKQQKIRRTFIAIVSAIIIVIIAGIQFHNFNITHFSKNTTINGIDCSWLTAEDAYNKINEHLDSKIIVFLFNDNSYTFPGSSFNLELGSVNEIEQLLNKQKSEHKQLSFSFPEFSINLSNLSENLLSIPELCRENMFYPEDAYITLSEDNLLKIVPEVIGNYIDFKNAYDLAYDGLKSGQTTIDFSSIMVSKPDSTSEDLKPIVESINDILNTSITFNISENSSLTLDKSIMKDWIIIDDTTGNYSIDIDSNVTAFVDILSEKCSGNVVYFDFNATDFGLVKVPAKKISIDKNAEIEFIKSELGSGNSITHTPIYDISIEGTYVEVDLARQHVWYYIDGICILDTDCVTGTRNHHDTREGYFFLTSKEKDRILRGYNDNGTKYASPVDFWMPFDGGIGLHDASWRNSFGGDIYLTNGSHGCVNLPRWAAEIIYNNIDYSTPIIVYYSTK